MKKNVGDLDAFVRLTAGFMMLGIGIVKKSKCIIGMGSMKVAEGIVRFCPLLYMMGLSTTEKDIFSCDCEDCDCEDEYESTGCDC